MAKEQLDSIEIKIELCRMLKELDEYLGGHGIQYSIMSGTLLGAVRHGDLFRGMMILILLFYERIMIV